MVPFNSAVICIAGLLGASAIGLDAYAAHGIAEQFGENAAQRVSLGARYQLIHALLLVGHIALLSHCHGRKTLQFSSMLIILGTLIFSGTLYTLAFTNSISLGWLTPIGGISLMMGWIIMIIAFLPLPFFKARPHKEDLESSSESP